MQKDKINQTFLTAFVKTPKNWLKKVTYNFSIGQKISYGYAISLGIAVLGTVTGFIIGDYSQRAARQQENTSQYEVRLLHRLQTALLQARQSQQEFGALMMKPEQLKNEYSEFDNFASDIEKIISELKSYINSDSYKQDQHAEGIPYFLQNYSSIPEKYIQQVKELMRRFPADKYLKSQDVKAAQQVLLEFSNNPVTIKFDIINDELSKIIYVSYREDEAARIALITAENMGFKIVVISMFLSVLFAAIFAHYTTQLLTKPIIAVTNAALRTTKELKFDFLVSVKTGDEVEVLANSLNTLILRLADYKNELELAQRTLENRVEERTQQLSMTLNSLQQTQAQLIQSEKMSALGQLVAGVAHEINNPVNFIYGNLTCFSNYTTELFSLIDFCQQRYSNIDPELFDLIQEIDLDFISKDLPKSLKSMKVGAERIREIVLSLRNFSRLDEAEMKEVDIHEGIESTLLILQHRLKSKCGHPIQIVKQYGNLPKIECYVGQLNQVFMNILVNAIDALEQQQMKYSLKQINHPSIITIVTENLEKSGVRIIIKDNGLGIPPEIKTLIFDPFFTTKPVGQGTGLGLSISYHIIVDKHKGKLTCLSEPGEGSEFQIEIPDYQRKNSEDRTEKTRLIKKKSK